MYNLRFDWAVDIVSYAVGLEKSDKSDQIDYHLHCFIQYGEDVYIDNLWLYLGNLYDSCTFDIQPCRSKRNALIYLSKEDHNVHTNIKTSMFHFNYRIRKWEESTYVYKHTDPFVVQHRHQYIFIKKYFDDFQKSKVRDFSGHKPWCGELFDGWHEGVVKWLYEWVHVIHDGLKVVEKRQLYLWGPTNVGKSSLIEKLIGKSNMKFVFYPGVRKFFMLEEFKFYCLKNLNWSFIRLTC